MPTYQYVCTSCGEALEVQQSFTDPALTVCPSCEGRLRKVFGAVGVVFKGSGFYRTDSRAAESTAKQNGSPGDAKPAAAKESAPGKDGAKSDAKAPAKSESSSAASKGSAA